MKIIQTNLLLNSIVRRITNTDVGSYKIVSVTKDGTYCEYLGDARK